jgi:hypothetical protein
VSGNNRRSGVLGTLAQCAGRISTASLNEGTVHPRLYRLPLPRTLSSGKPTVVSFPLVSAGINMTEWRDGRKPASDPP